MIKGHLKVTGPLEKNVPSACYRRIAVYYNEIRVGVYVFSFAFFLCRNSCGRIKLRPQPIPFIGHETGCGRYIGSLTTNGINEDNERHRETEKYMMKR